MNLSRRHALALGGAAITVTLVPVNFALASESSDAAIQAFTGGAAVGDGGVDLTTPEIAENGNTVPISVTAMGATSIMIIADGNPNAGVATFHFGDMAEPTASTRIRLAGTQNVVAIAKMADGSFKQASHAVKVTIGGCGG
jgi:sulfur-oxidizing protein SoxY